LRRVPGRAERPSRAADRAAAGPHRAARGAAAGGLLQLPAAAVGRPAGEASRPPPPAQRPQAGRPARARKNDPPARRRGRSRRGDRPLPLALLGLRPRPRGRRARECRRSAPPAAVRAARDRGRRHRAPRLRAALCELGSRTRARLPVEVAASAFGPRLQAALALLSVRNRISRRDVSELSAELFGCPLSIGSVDAICQRASSALAAPYGELREAVKDAPVVCVDETGWRCAGERRTLWGALSERAAAFHIAADRHERELPELIGTDFAGIVSSDRWWAYDQLDPRAAPSLLDAPAARLSPPLRRPGPPTALRRGGPGGLPGAVRGLGPLPPARRPRTARPRDHPAQAHAAAAARPCPDQARQEPPDPHLRAQPAQALARPLDVRRGRRRRTDQQPRRARAARRVIYRKISLGSQSDAGERFAERMLSISQTCRQQRRSLFAYLIEALRASARGSPTPSLT
jgi:transposase